MERIKELKQKRPDGYTDSIPLGADAACIDVTVNRKKLSELNPNQSTLQSEASLQEVIGEYKKSGSIADILERHFCGTWAEWENLSDNEKVDYDYVDILEQYIIHYDRNSEGSGSGSMADDIKSLGEPYIIKNCAFTLDSVIDTNYTIDSTNNHRYKQIYKFTYEDWNTDPDGVGITKEPGDRYLKDANLNLYAQWKKEPNGITNEQYRIIINADDGVENITVFGADENDPNWVDKGGSISFMIETKPNYLVLSQSEEIADVQGVVNINVTTVAAVRFNSDSSFTLAGPDHENSTFWDNMEYLDNENNWVTWDGSQLSRTANNPIYLRGKGNNMLSGVGYPWRFTGTTVEGNIELLLDYEETLAGEHPDMWYSEALAEMFKGCTSLVTAPDLLMPVLQETCYMSMFEGCTSLVNAPTLPAEALEDSCYNSMFKGCSSLVNAPELPVEALANYCYCSMFEGCTSLVNAPELPATELADSCYRAMFNGCTHLIITPLLPAITLKAMCYYNMFEDCTALTAMPQLPATELAENCYYGMFKGCTNLVTLVDLPVLTLAQGCYYEMFSGCTALKISTAYDETDYPYSFRIPKEGTGTDATNALTNMFANTGGSFDTGTPVINTIYYTDHLINSQNNYIYYYANDGSGDDTIQTKLQNTSVNIRSNMFMPGNYDEQKEENGYRYTEHHIFTFNHWNTEADDSGTSYNANDVYDVNENLNLYAIWDDTTTITDEQYYLTVNKDNGVQTATPSQWVIKGNSVNVTAAPKQGYQIVSGTGNTGAINEAKTVDIISTQIFTISWSSALAESGSYLANGDAAISEHGGDKSIEYTNPNGTVSYITPYQAGSITIKAGTAIILRMIGGDSLSGELTWDINNQDYDPAYPHGTYLVTSSYIPTSNGTLIKTGDYVSTNIYGGYTYDWGVSFT